MKKVIILGGDGFCGWPTSLHLSQANYEVHIVDNLMRRMIDIELGCDSLTPIATHRDRRTIWAGRTENFIRSYDFDVSKHYHRLLTLIQDVKPYAICHFAEQCSAPYSMKSSHHKRFTVNNNLNATNNVLAAIVESGIDTHLVHLGTTGYYGYSSVGMKIPEGYLKIKVNVDGEDKEMEIPYPPDPGSIYHLTKCQDALFFYYYNKNDRVRITDLHQGIVWGTQTEETSQHDMLINRFDYDGDFGTVLNRFIMQSQVGHPITVYGSGGQTRAFINIQDTVRCIKLAIENPPKRGDRVRILNQTAECLNIKELAYLVQDMTDAEIRYYKNPRVEAPRNDLAFQNEGLKSLGWKPILLDDGLLDEIALVASKYKERCDKRRIFSDSLWNKSMLFDLVGSEKPIGE